MSLELHEPPIELPTTTEYQTIQLKRLDRFRSPTVNKDDTPPDPNPVESDITSTNCFEVETFKVRENDPFPAFALYELSGIE